LSDQNRIEMVKGERVAAAIMIIPARNKTVQSRLCVKCTKIGRMYPPDADTLDP